MIWIYLVVFIFGVTFVYASWRAAPWLPMYREDVERAVKLAGLKPGEKFYDIGAGDGRTLFAAAAAGAVSSGLEISLLPYLITKFKIIFSIGKNKPKIYFRDFWRMNMGEADAIFVFLMPRIMQKLRKKMEQELKPGTRVICYTWPMPDCTPAQVDNIPGRPKIYLYTR